jgi:hypothetical protein
MMFLQKEVDVTVESWAIPFEFSKLRVEDENRDTKDDIKNVNL